MASPRPFHSTWLSSSSTSRTGNWLAILVAFSLGLAGDVSQAAYSDAVTSLGPVGYWRFDDPPGPNRVAFYDEFGNYTGSYERRGKVKNGYREGFEESATEDGDQAVWFRGNCKENDPGVAFDKPGFAWVPGWTTNNAPDPLPPIPTAFNTPEGTISMFVMPTDLHKADGVFFSRDHVSPALIDEHSIEISGNPVTTGIRADIEAVDSSGNPVFVRLQQPPYGGTNHQDWYHVTVTWKSSGANRGVRLYVEGELVDENSDVLLDLTNNPDPMVIGASQKFSPVGQQMPLDNNVFTFPYCGGVDELALFNFQLNESQIQELLASSDTFVSNRDLVVSGNNTDTVAGVWSMRPGHVYSYRYDPDAPYDGVVTFPLIPGQVLGTSEPICVGEQNCDLHGIHIRDNGNLIGTFTTGPSFVTYAGAKDDPKFPHIKLRPREVFEYNPHVLNPNAPAGSAALGPVTTSLWGDPIAPGTAVKLLDENVYTNSTSVDIDAISVSRDLATGQELSLLISTVQNMNTDKGFASGYVGWDDHDIVEWNGSSTTRDGLAPGAARLFWSAGFEGANQVFRRDEDIDAFALLPNGLYLLSTTSSSSGGNGLLSLGRRYFRDGDVIEYNATANTIDGLPAGKARKIVDERVAFATDSHVDLKAVHGQAYMEGFSFNYPSTYGTACHPKRISVNTRNSQHELHPQFGDKGEVTELILREKDGTLITDQFELEIVGAGKFTDIFGNELADSTRTETGPIFFQWQAGNDGVAEFDLTFKHPSKHLDIDIEQVGRRWIADNDDVTISFFPYGLLLTDNNPTATGMTPKFAGVHFTPKITAYGMQDGGECGVIETYTGTKTLHAWMKQVDPVDGEELIIYGGNELNARAPLSIPLGGGYLGLLADIANTNLTLEFVDGVATFGPLRYDDVGKISLCLVDMRDEEETIYMNSEVHAPWTANCDLGSVNPVEGMQFGPFGEGTFVVAPDHFKVEFSQILDSGTAGASAPVVDPNDGVANPIFARAGESFEVTVTAMTGAPGGKVAQSFGYECQSSEDPPVCKPEDVRLHAEILAPSHSGVNDPEIVEIPDPNLSVVFNFKDGNRDGVAKATFTYPEVGIIGVRANVADAQWDWDGDGTQDTPGNPVDLDGYLASDIGARSFPSVNLGRFIPYQFAIANVTQGLALATGVTDSDSFLRPGCERYIDTSEPSDGIFDVNRSFTYAGQPLKGQVHLQAINASGGITQNYVNVDGWAKLDVDDSDLADHNGFRIRNLSGVSYQGQTLEPTISGFLNSLDFSSAPSGAATLDLNVNYDFNDVPHTLTLTMDLEEPDLWDFYTTVRPDITSPPPHLLGGSVNVASPQFRWGRLNIPNAYGSEAESGLLDVPIRLEYFADIGGGAWVTNVDEGVGGTACSCLGLEAAQVTAGDDVDFRGDAIGQLFLTNRGLPKFESIGGHPPGDRSDAELTVVRDSTTEIREIETLNGGEAMLRYARPGAGNQFTFPQTYPLDGLVGIGCSEDPEWLKFDWNGNGPESPTTRITYGIYKGSRKRVFVREVY